jgi:hypothetical protein
MGQQRPHLLADLDVDAARAFQWSARRFLLPVPRQGRRRTETGGSFLIWSVRKTRRVVVRWACISGRELHRSSQTTGARWPTLKHEVSSAVNRVNPRFSASTPRVKRWGAGAFARTRPRAAPLSRLSFVRQPFWCGSAQRLVSCTERRSHNAMHAQ